MGGRQNVAALVEECRRPELPGIVPSRQWSLAAVPELLLEELARARRGLIVLGVDGVSHGAAARAWPSAEVTYLTSTVPSTSATAWLTALTGAWPDVHGVPGMVYRAGGGLVYAVTGTRMTGEGVTGEGVTGEGVTGEHVTSAHVTGAPGAPRPEAMSPDGIVLAQRTVFERAAARGIQCLALGRELHHLPGPWAPALLRGTVPAAAPPPPATLAEHAAKPALLAEAVTADVTAVLAAAAGPTLLWVYVNLDDYVHTSGYDGAALDALRGLDRAAGAWTQQGWTVVAHSDHGQVPVRPDPELARAWTRMDDPAECELPSGGAGRLRWLYPRPGREDAVREWLADALGDAAVVVTADELHLTQPRAGAVVAIAASDRFPIPNPELRYEHGALEVDEMVVPFAVWRPPGC